MRWCKKCCEPDTRPTCIFDDEGICYPCHYMDELKKGKISWEDRAEKLQSLVAWSRGASKASYDCIIGVSGGKDSTRQALFARKAGLNPLLVSLTYPPEQQVERGAKNLENLISLGFDTFIVSPAPGTSKALMKNCFLKFGNLFNAAELALYACLPKIAIAYQIPMILLGENPALAWGTAAGGSMDFLGNSMRHTNTLQGGDYNKFLAAGMTAKDVYWYRYPSDEELQRANIKIVYLGYFIKDFNDHTNSRVAIENGMSVREGIEAYPESTGSFYNSICLDEDFVLVNQMLKYYKYGFGMASQEVSGRIRHGLMTREEGIKFVHKYDGRLDRRYIQRAASYIGMSEEEFMNIAELYRNKEIFYQNERDEWALKNPVS
jgi:N-acetyl sugar amidotransferase